MIIELRERNRSHDVPKRDDQIFPIDPNVGQINVPNIYMKSNARKIDP